MSLDSPLSPLEVGNHSLVFSLLLAMFHPRSALLISLNQSVHIFFLAPSQDLTIDNLQVTVSFLAEVSRVSPSPSRTNGFTRVCQVSKYEANLVI